MPSPDLHKIAAMVAQEQRIPIPLLEAIITVESNWQTNCWKFEPPYRYLWDNAKDRPFRQLTPEENHTDVPPPDFAPMPHCDRATEFIGQQASWGLGQVMGAVAREYGFKGDFTLLCIPDNGILYAGHHLNRLARRYLADHGWQGVAAAYNAGSPRIVQSGSFVNQGYVDKVAAAGGF